MSRHGFSRIGYPFLVGSLAFGTAAMAQNQSTSGNPTDAQVEANVLRALAGAPELSTQNIQSSTVYGTVTLTGNVHDEAMRTKAENLVARAVGVKKVVDELSLGDAAAPADQASTADQNTSQPPNCQLQSDGTCAPADATSQQAENTPPPIPNQGQPSYSQQQPTATPQQQPQNNQYPGGYGPPQGQQPNAPPSGNQQYPGGYGPPQDQSQQPNYAPPAGNQQYPDGYGPPDQSQAQPHPGQRQPYGQPQPYGQQQPYGPPPQRHPLYNNGPQQAYAPPGGQQAGIPVTVPAGSMLRIRINRGLDANHIQPGTPFDGTVLNDVAADGAIAIPRGASVQGTVVDAKKAGALSGQGAISLEINSVTLSGVAYPLQTQLWEQQGRNKSTTTVDSALGLGALGAILGGVAGGGAGAAIGAAAGAGVGVAGSAASPSGRVIVPPEAVIAFQLAQPAVVKTVSEQEMGRLGYAAGPNPQQPPMRRYYSPYYGYYYAPYYGR